MIPIIRRIPDASKQIFLTFDDGPVVGDTERVLDILEQYDAKATFFCVAEKARNHQNLVERIQSQGHSIGNHSLDHRFSNFFASKMTMKNWIEESQQVFVEDLGVSPVGFRSPAGVITPPLTQVLQELDIPLIHWNRRFFDTSIPLNWMDKFNRYRVGDILLLHDCQRPWLRQSFIKNLPRLIEKLAHKGFDFQALTKENFLHGC